MKSLTTPLGEVQTSRETGGNGSVGNIKTGNGCLAVGQGEIPPCSSQ
jgi:hypothetical protein